MTPTTVPLLTVVVPVHLVADYLPACLDSVLADAGPDDVEVVAVDDCSPDTSGAILDRYARQDPRVRVVRLATNVGLGRARNAGLERARGRYVWFVDGDDWLPAGAVGAVLDRLAGTAPDVLLIDHVEVRPDGRIRPPPPAPELPGAGSRLPAAAGSRLPELGEPVPVAQRPELLTTTLSTSACTKVVRRAFLEATGLRFPPGWYEDVAYSHPLLLAAERIDTLDRVCYCYRQRERTAITKSVSPRHFEVLDQYQRLWTVVEQLAPAYDAFRPALFRLMVDHLLVVAGNERRLPPRLRREFFRRVAAAYHRWLPAEGYPAPAGAAGLKHRLVRRDAYLPYAVLRLGWRAAARLRPPARRTPAPAAPQPASLAAR